MLSDIQIIVFLLFIMASCQVAGLMTRRPTEDRALILSPVIVFVIVLVLFMMFSSSMM